MCFVPIPTQRFSSCEKRCILKHMIGDPILDRFFGPASAPSLDINALSKVISEMIQQLTPPPPPPVPIVPLHPPSGSNSLIDDNITIVDGFIYGLIVMVFMTAAYFMNRYLELRKLDIISANEMISNIKKKKINEKIIDEEES